MNVGVVDIGTNSVRLLITDGIEDVGRWEEVTGLGRGIASTGRLSEEAVARTLAVLRHFGDVMDDAVVGRRAAIATSATRDAANRDEFVVAAERALGVRPAVIAGQREGRLAYSGATSRLDGADFLVCDIGGGSTELVTARDVASFDIGSVRLSDTLLTSRPAGPGELAHAREAVGEILSGVKLRGDLVGAAGTWTSLAAIDLELHRYEPELVHGHLVAAERLARITDRLAAMTLEETAAIPALDPARAPVILSGAVVAGCVMEHLSSPSAVITRHDSLDGLAIELLAVT